MSQTRTTRRRTTTARGCGNFSYRNHNLASNSCEKLGDFDGKHSSQSTTSNDMAASYDNNVAKPPKHAQNPIFISQLRNRFNSMLPPSTILSSEVPQQLLANQSLPKTSDPSFSGKNKMQDSINENNSQRPFAKSCKDHNITHSEELQHKEKRNQRSNFKKSGFKQKNIHDPANEDTRNFKMNVDPSEGFKTMKSNDKGTRTQEIQPNSSNDNSNHYSHQRTNKCNSPETSYQDILFTQLDSFAKNRNGQNQFEKNGGKIKIEENVKEEDVFLQIKSFISNSRNKSYLHKSNPSNSASSEYLVESDDSKKTTATGSQANTTHNFGTKNESTRSGNSCSNQIQSSIVKNVIQTEGLNGFNSQITNSNEANFHCSKPSSIINTEKSFVCQSKNESRSLPDSIPSSTNFRQAEAQNERTSKNLPALKESEKLHLDSVKLVPERQKNKKHERRNEILRSHGFPGRPDVNNSSYIKKENSKSLPINLAPQLKPPSGTISKAKWDDMPMDSNPNKTEQHNAKKFELPIQNRSNHTFNKPDGNQSTSNSSIPPSHLSRSVNLNAQTPSHPHRNVEHQRPGTINRDNTPVGGSELINGEFAGRNVFNIERPAQEPNQRVATQNEALRRLENEYAQQLIVHQRKEQEKEAKKRAERLARYEHVDQGYRMTEGYLDEAIGGFDPTNAYAHFESEEEVRRIQQEQLKRDALFFQEQEKERMERLKKRDEEKKKKEMEKYKHFSPGYKLGGSEKLDMENDAQRLVREEEIRQKQQEQLKRDALIFQEQEQERMEKLRKKEEEKNKKEMEKYEHFSPGYKLGGSEKLDMENDVQRLLREEEIRQKQQEQFRMAALIFQKNQKRNNEVLRNREEDKEAKKLDKHEHVNCGEHLESDGGGRIKSQKTEHARPQDTQSYTEAAKSIQQSHSDSSLDVDPNVAEISEALLNLLESNGILNKSVLEGDETKQKLLSQLQNVIAKKSDVQTLNGQDSTIEKSTKVGTCSITSSASFSPEQPTAACRSPLHRPVSCTVKTSHGDSVLVIRPTTDALQHTVSSLVALEDFDKRGKSALYTPQVEQAPKYSNNRFQHRPLNSSMNNNYSFGQHTPQAQVEIKAPCNSKSVETQSMQKALDEVAKSIGAIPKLKATDNNLNPPNVTTSTSSSNEDPEGCDFQEELRKARLKMQERYNAILKQ